MGTSCMELEPNTLELKRSACSAAGIASRGFPAHTNPWAVLNATAMRDSCRETEQGQSEKRQGERKSQNPTMVDRKSVV